MCKPNAMNPDAEDRPTKYRERPEGRWEVPSSGPVVARADFTLGVAERSRRRRLLGSVAGMVLLLGLLAKIVWPVAGASGSPEFGPWDVRMTSGGARSVVALVYGKEAGLHLIRVPASANGSQPALLSAKLGEAPLYVVSLGRAPLEVTAIAPAADQSISWAARGRFIQSFIDSRGTGVRTW